VFQFFHLLPTLNAVENAALPLLLDGRRPAEANGAAAKVLDRLGIAARAEHRPRELSGGEQQRVAIARALVSEPSLLLADEPTGNLDSASGADVHAILRSLPEAFGTAIVMVTHDRDAVRPGDRSLHLQDGILEELAKAS
jgi:predicted ABC-type transport system involved in lysophospholipase L1 biosynthesis ATPase subunit